MKLKNINKTNSYKYVTMRDIKNDWRGRKILTPTGYVEIKDFFFAKRNKTVHLKLSNGSIFKCDPEHKLLVKRNTSKIELFAKDLKHTDKLIGFNDIEINFNKSDGPEEDLYDISIDNPHWYFTNGIISHNSIAICNNAAACLRKGLKVYHVTCELSWYKTACRYCGILSRTNIKHRFDHKDHVIKTLNKVKKTYGGDLFIQEFPSDTISIRNILAAMDFLKKTKGWIPDVVAVDYLELLVSENEYFNREQYGMQKKIATEMRKLARITNAYIITATQTNRGNNEGKKEEDSVIDINRVSESFGKMMPSDYVVSINQSKSEYGSDTCTIKEKNENGEMVAKEKRIPAKMRLYIAKNRNGPKFKTVNTVVDFSTMIMKEMIESEENNG